MPHDSATVRSAFEQPCHEHAAIGVGGVPEAIAGTRIMFMYWGRCGLSRFVRDLMAATDDTPCAEAILSLSRQNDEFASFIHLGARLFPVETFAAGHAAITEVWRIPRLRRELAARLKWGRTDVVIDLMPHVWSPFVIPAIKSAGARYICVLHDAIGHPGDRSGLLTPLLRRTACRADHVLALSRAVGNRLLATGRLPPDRLTVLFHPDLDFTGSKQQPRRAAPAAPLRLLFLGRIMAYKGLPLFLDTVDRLRAEGVSISPGVFGEGSIAPHGRRMAEMGVELVNRRLSDAEVGDVLLRYDALVASHVEASQSGVVAAALGAGMPCVVTPVGGLLEQIVDGETGTVASETTAAALSGAVRRLFFTPNLYRTICCNIVQRRGEHSMGRFLVECARVADAVAGGLKASSFRR
jgi:glycosyltransferase involved in cell wall biosynthesis